jgi:hypothetical protein
MPIKPRRRTTKVVPVPKQKFFDVKTIVFIAFFLIAGILYFIYSDSDKQEVRKTKANKVRTEQKDVVEPQTFEARPDSPSVTKAKLQLESVDNKDTLKIVAEGNTIGNTPVSFRYEWTKNGKPVEGGSDSISGFKRGDKITVKIMPYIGEALGLARTLSIEIKNSTPKVTEDKQVNFNGTLLTYQVKATDPDGDMLTYSLVDAPRDMTIDSSSGLIRLPVKEDTPSSISFKVKISDGNGGDIIYPLTMSVEKAAPVKATPAPTKK